MSLLASGMYAGQNCSIAENKLNISLFKEESKLCLLNRIKPAYPKIVIEELVENVKTPEEAFNMTYALLKFPNDNQKLKAQLKFCNGEGYYSLLESLSVGGGVCRDGAIAFCSFLSNNPEFKCQIIALYDNQWNKTAKNHAIAIFQENGKQGYASFNDDTTGKGSVFQNAKYNSINHLLGVEFKMFKSYAKIELTPEEMKFGRAMVNVKIKEKEEITDYVPFEEFKEQYEKDLKDKQKLKTLIEEYNE